MYQSPKQPVLAIFALVALMFAAPFLHVQYLLLLHYALFRVDLDCQPSLYNSLYCAHYIVPPILIARSRLFNSPFTVIKTTYSVLVTKHTRALLVVRFSLGVLLTCALA